MSLGNLIWFLLGFVVRGVISIISSATYTWRSERAWRRYARRVLKRDLERDPNLTAADRKRMLREYDTDQRDRYVEGDPEMETPVEEPMRWKVRVWGIVWDDGKGEYDVSDLPRDLEIIVVDALDDDDALRCALEEASEKYTMLIQDVAKAEIDKLPERRKQPPVRRDDLE